MIRLHATCVALDGDGVLLRGPSGAGKSDLALRLLGAGACLVADDYTDVHVAAGRLIATAPPPIVGLFEVRGLGVVRLSEAERRDEVAVAAIVDLVAAPDVPRLPDPAIETILDVSLPRYWLAPLEASAADKVRLAVRLATGRIKAAS